MFVVTNPTLKKAWFKCSVTYIITALLFGGIIYFLPGYQEPDPEFVYDLSLAQCISLGFGLAFVVYFLYFAVLYLLSMQFKKTIKVIVKAFIALAIVAVLFVSFGGLSESSRLPDIIQTFAIMALFFSVPYIESVVDKSQNKA